MFSLILDRDRNSLQELHIESDSAERVDKEYHQISAIICHSHQIASTACTSVQAETNFVLAGLLLHLAQKSGLHVPAGSDEFFRAKMPNFPDKGIDERSELWAHIVLIYQRCVPETPVGSGISNLSRSCLCKGFLARTSGDVSPEMSQCQARQQTLPSTSTTRIKWQDLCVQCGSAVSDIGIRNLTADQDCSLSLIILGILLGVSYFLRQDHASQLASFDKIQQVSLQVTQRGQSHAINVKSGPSTLLMSVHSSLPLMLYFGYSSRLCLSFTLE
ncbi:hypothetical protein E4T39_05758 [Aureobasidium subglaciale]|nr:hypothetical protein E4T39_05758 [Aureobasidium subglaciale]